MIKFKLVLLNSVIEFSTQEEAEAFKIANNISEPIESFESVPVLIPGNFQPITPRQIRLVLFSMGITSEMVVAAIEAAIPSPDKELALIEWEYAIAFERYAPFVGGVGALLGLSEDQIDSLWLQAAQI